MSMPESRYQLTRPLFFLQSDEDIQRTLTMASENFQSVLPPWKLKGTIYLFAFWSSKSQVEDAGSLVYSPLEAGSSFSSTIQEGGRHVGGLSMIQIIRYSASPVGPYDELIISPGAHDYVVEENGKRVTKRSVRITRIYVSQKYTCWNGRKSRYPRKSHLKSQVGRNRRRERNVEC